MFDRSLLSAYAHILTGALLRLVLQGAYFAALVNALSLADYGVFASALALSLILSGGGTFGFTATMFRAATTRRRVLGSYLAAFLAYAAVEAGLLVAVGCGLWFAILGRYIPLPAFMAILLSESLFWRLGDMLNTLSIGLGHYRHGIAIGAIASGARLLAVLAFSISGDHGVATWSGFYVCGNALAAVACAALFWPRVRLRWTPIVLRRRLREAVSFWAINTLQTLQIEADKLIVLTLAGERQAGVYALSMRIIELLIVPLKSALPPYIKGLLRHPDPFADWRRSLAVETVIAGTAGGLFAAAAIALWLVPGLLGRNVAEASHWFAGLPLLPVSRALLEYHREVMFAAERLATYAMVSAVLATLRLTTVAGVLSLSGLIGALVLPLNVLAVVLFAISATVVWTQVIRPSVAGPKAVSRP